MINQGQDKVDSNMKPLDKRNIYEESLMTASVVK